MIAAVIERHLEIDYRESGEESLRGCFHNSFLHRGNEISRDRASEDLIDELKVLSARQGLHSDLAVAVLTVPTRLLLVSALNIRVAADSFPIRNFGSLQDDFDPIALAQLCYCHLDVKLPRSGQEKLFGLRISIVLERRVLFGDAGQRVADLVLIAAALWLD